MLMMVAAVTRYHKIFGIDLSEEREEVATVSTSPDGETVINTTLIGRDIRGFAGPVPLEVYIKDGVIVKVRLLDSDETPEFIGTVKNKGLLRRFEGHTPEEVVNMSVDAVSGATFSSKAVIANVRAAAAYALDESNGVLAASESPDLDYKFFLTLAVILAGGVIPLFLRNRKYRIVQLVLNVIVLGFWGGTYLCYTRMVDYLGNGPGNFLLALPLLLMLVAAFVYPMFRRPDHYCNWMCPYGSLQELVGKVVPVKFHLSKGAVQALTLFRDALWFALMWLLWTGLWFDWMNYEVFAAFFITTAGPVVLGIAGGFLLLSLVFHRPYCNFVCPTGTLFKLTEGRK